jgi:hypothetical protein
VAAPQVDVHRIFRAEPIDLERRKDRQH